jgi:hypothetical protein
VEWSRTVGRLESWVARDLQGCFIRSLTRLSTFEELLRTLIFFRQHYPGHLLPLLCSSYHHSFSPTTPSHLSSILPDTFLSCSDRNHAVFKTVKSCMFPLYLCTMRCVASASTDSLNSFPELHLPPHAQQIFFAHPLVHHSCEDMQMMRTRRFEVYVSPTGFFALLPLMLRPRELFQASDFIFMS